MEHQNDVWNLFKVNSKNANDVIDVVMVFSLLTLNKFYIIFWCLYDWLWTGKHRLGIDIFKFYVNLSRRTCMVCLKFSTWFFLHQKKLPTISFFFNKKQMLCVSVFYKPLSPGKSKHYSALYWLFFTFIIK